MIRSWPESHTDSSVWLVGALVDLLPRRYVPKCRHYWRDGLASRAQCDHIVGRHQGTNRGRYVRNVRFYMLAVSAAVRVILSDRERVYQIALLAL